MKSLITCLALAGVLLIGTSVYAFGPNGLVGSMGSGIMGSGIMGSGIMGSGIMGSGIMGSGIMGSGIMGSGIMGSGIMSSGVNASGIWDRIKKWFEYPNRNSGNR
ncbi:hypothetical protein BMS3Bbin06_00298 [bacterium BMS3Bbin06]|nr:hypothetical protein BMS3Bbin06_00298 [bacterium BMS3Bbin06]